MGHSSCPPSVTLRNYGFGFSSHAEHIDKCFREAYLVAPE